MVSQLYQWVNANFLSDPASPIERRIEGRDGIHDPASLEFEAHRDVVAAAVVRSDALTLEALRNIRLFG